MQISELLCISELSFEYKFVQFAGLYLYTLGYVMAPLKIPTRLIFTPKTEIKNAHTSTGGQFHNMKIKLDLNLSNMNFATAYTL